MDIGLGPGVPLEVSVSLLRVLQKWARLALQPTAAEPKCAVPKSRSQFCPLGGCGSKGLCGDCEEENAGECPRKLVYGRPVQYVQLHHRRCVRLGGRVQLEGGRDGRGHEGGNNIASSDCLASVIIFSLQPATLFFWGSGWASLAVI